MQDVVRDYLLWFTKVGSIERVFDIETYKNFKVHLRCLDQESPQEICFGHLFPPEDSDIIRLFEEKGAARADW